jgi:hypothetical protein
MPPTVHTSVDYPVDKLSYGKNKPNANGGFNIEICVGDTANELLLQTPRMRAPFGISTNKNNLFKKEIDISFQGSETNSSVKKFRNLIESIDSNAIDYAFSNSKTFFKKELSRETIKECYCSGIKLSKKEQYSDTFKLKLLFLKPNPEKNIPDGKYLTTFWNHKGVEQDSTYVDKGDTVSCLIKPQMLWVANRTFGITWVCTQVRITKQVKVTGYAFRKTEDFDELDDDDVSEIADSDTPVINKLSLEETIVESGSDEDVEVDDDE